MKTLMFAGQHYIPTVTGKKLITIRKFDLDKHDFDDGEQVMGIFRPSPGFGGAEVTLAITNGGTRVMRARHLPVSMVRRDGFLNVADAIAGLAKYYDYFDELTWSAIIQFEVAA